MAEYHVPLEALVSHYELNVDIVKRQAAGLTHEDSLRQAPYNINCLNWVIGHIVASRDNLLKRLDVPPVMSAAEHARYVRESQPVKIDAPDIIRLERLLEMLDETQRRISGAVAVFSADDFKREVKLGQRAQTVGETLLFSFFHDSYHVGQTDLLRQISGKSDKLI